MTAKAASWVLASTVLAAPAAAHVPEWEAAGSPVAVTIEVDGRSAPLYPARDGSGRFYVEARRGAEYVVRLANRSADRMAVLLAVDGLNVISGEREAGPERTGRPGRMYVLEPWDDTLVRGWRTSLDEVRRFTFVEERGSYAARSGKANAKMGWIEAWAYRERGPRCCPPPRERITPGGPVPQDGRRNEDQPSRDADAPAAEAGAASPRAQSKRADGLSQREGRDYPGTGWGASQSDPAVVVHFDAQPHPAQRIVVRYEYGPALRALGILPRHHDRLRERDRGEGFAKAPVW